MRFERVRRLLRCRCCSPGEIRSRSRMHAHARATHTHTIHDDTTGPEGGDCMLVDGGSGGPSQELHGPPNCRKPALERLARHSLFDRYMKAQLRLAGGRRKLGRNGFSSDRPRECVDPPEYLRDLRDLRDLHAGGERAPNQCRRRKGSNASLLASQAPPHPTRQ